MIVARWGKSRAFFCVCCALVWAQAGWAELAGALHSQYELDHFTAPPSSYVAPNEHNPARAVALLKAAPAGVYAALGSERGFIGAALAKAPHLLLLDSNYTIVFFNRINIALLAAAKSLDHYRYLRLHPKAGAAIWKLAAEEVEVADGVSEILKDERVWEWWQRYIRATDPLWVTDRWVNVGHRAQHFALLHKAPHAERFHAFQGANYLYDEELFNHLHALAVHGRIASIQVDLTDLNRLREIMSVVQGAGFKLGVVDFSNIWDGEDHLGLRRTASALQVLSAFAHPGAVVTFSIERDEARREDPRFSKRSAIIDWDYFGFTFEQFQQFSKEELWYLFEQAVYRRRGMWQPFDDTNGRLNGTVASVHGCAQAITQN